MGIENAAYYSTAPLRDTLKQLVDLDYLNAGHARLALGAVKICSGEMVYVDSRKHPLPPEHIMAPGAFPPACLAACVDVDYYWDGGIYSNTPLEAVLDDNPRPLPRDGHRSCPILRFDDSDSFCHADAWPQSELTGYAQSFSADSLSVMRPISVTNRVITKDRKTPSYSSN